MVCVCVQTSSVHHAAQKTFLSLLQLNPSYVHALLSCIITLSVEGKKSTAAERKSTAHTATADAKNHYISVTTDPRLLSVCGDMFKRSSQSCHSGSSAVSKGGNHTDLDAMIAAMVGEVSANPSMSQIPESMRILSLYTNDKGLVARLKEVLHLFDGVLPSNHPGAVNTAASTSCNTHYLSLGSKWKRNLGRSSNI